MKRLLFLAAFAAFALAAYAENPAEASLVPGLLWGGTWESEKNLSTRADLDLNIPEADWEFLFRFTDRRPAGSWDAFKETFAADNPGALSSLSLGAYLDRAGKNRETAEFRLLYGMMSPSGLAARIKRPWTRGSPFAENHFASQTELRTEVSSTALPALYLYWGSPELGFGKMYGAFSLESEGERGSSFSFEGGRPGLTAGTELSLGKKRFLRLEGYYTEGTLPERRPASWFSAEGALPERDFRVYAGSARLDLPVFGFAADGAWSETFAFGRGFYGNLGLRFGDRPWRLSLAADGAGSRYVGPDGGASGAAMRFAARLERRGKRSALFRLEGVSRANEVTNASRPGEGAENFLELARPNRYSLSAYYRFPADRAALRFSRASLKLSADERERKKETAAADALFGVAYRQFGLESRFKLSGKRNAVSGGEYEFDSFSLHESLVWTGGFLQYKAGLGYTETSGKKPLWDASLSAAVRGKRGWFRARLDSPRLFETWALSLSWLARW